ncbi:hypothetical protein [Neisseria meningitidis]|uniref:hypothetical protein n=1 Tax=Neisseria meningitidis TaxID=487 RepID=UPI000C33EB4A|nr:hypothetical protein [Neisseria meningitidis]MBG8963950.1 hypothetical protein [Neisseria meningitidis]MBG8975993.1 hypothetical protein [Neisseria meningitidis]MBG8978035.1 hypothetical protein [Neisseria meningitidis]MBG8984595.1 hypothetical protein [Neisseria meningitidis]MBG8988677.1 hypothetical protein [Neisseria meningitidis]
MFYNIWLFKFFKICIFTTLTREGIGGHCKPGVIKTAKNVHTRFLSERADVKSAPAAGYSGLTKIRTRRRSRRQYK